MVQQSEARATEGASGLAREARRGSEGQASNANWRSCRRPVLKALGSNSGASGRGVANRSSSTPYCQSISTRYETKVAHQDDMDQTDLTLRLSIQTARRGVSS